MSPRGAAFLTLLAAACVVGTLAIRELSMGHDEAIAGDVMAARANWPAAVAHARAAAEASVPGSPWAGRGFRRLEWIGHEAEVRGDDVTALLAYGAIRTAALATRSPFSGAGWRSVGEGGLARAAASRGTDAERRAAAAAMVLALRSGTDGPGPRTFLLLSASSLAMLVGVAWVANGARFALAGRGLVAAGFLTYALVMLAH